MTMHAGDMNPKNDPIPFLESAGFFDYGEFRWIPERQRVDIACCEAYSRETVSVNGCVYAWVVMPSEVYQGNPCVLYVGYSANNPHHRRSTWLSALNKGLKTRLGAGKDAPEPPPKGAGARTGSNVRQMLRQGHRMNFWTHVSERRNLWGQDVSIAKAEEDALLAIFRPIWNGEFVREPNPMGFPR